jgi:ureidoacrylate peracid hydrolase
MEFDAARAAFVAVDLQRAFCGEDGSTAANGRDISQCQTAAARCIEMAAAAHRAGMRVIWTRFVLRPDYADGGVMTDHMRPWIREHGALRDGTPDIELIPEAAAEVTAADFVIDKPRYSSFLATGLDTILRACSIECLMVGGLTTSMCVESTVRDAAQRDYKTFLVRDACADYWEDRHLASLEAIGFGFARVISHNEAIAAMDAGKATF